MKKTNLILALIVSSLGFSQNNTFYSRNSPTNTDSNMTSSILLGSIYGLSNATDRNIYIGEGVEASLGDSNIVIGAGSGFYSGGNNLTLGNDTGLFASGDNNIAIGSFNFESANGDHNISLGDRSGEGQNGDSNIYIGEISGGYSSGDKNIFIGYKAGQNVDESNKLIIDNNTGDTPLIYGDTNTKQLSIGTTTIPTDTNYKLAVGGSIVAEELLVALQNSSDWPDYVFKTDYKLASLKQVEQHIAEKGHLANIPSAKEIKEKGIMVGDMNAKLLRKVEELTLYTIDQQKQIEELKLLVNTLVTNKK